MRRTTLTTLAPLFVVILLTSCAEGTDVQARRDPVIQGTPVDETVFPAAGALVTQGMFFCSGTLVTPTVVVTAAHCLDPMFIGASVPGFTFVADANSVSPADVHPGREALPHPDFDLFDPAGAVHDIGLLFLEEPVEGVEPVPLATPDDVAALAPGDMLDLVGYGLTRPDGFEAGVKHHGRAALTAIDTFMYGIGTPGEVQNCNGDSGGPAFYEIAPGEHRVIGVVTGGPEPCTMGGFDIRVDAHHDWLVTSMGEVPAECEPPLTRCGAACLDLSANAENCGACGRACLADETCESGRCVVMAAPDAGPPALTDAGVGLPDGNLILDAGPGMETPDGCTCRASARRSTPRGWLGMLVALGLVAWRRRRG